MSIEGPEAHLLAGQMRDELTGRRVVSCELRDTDKLQALGFVNREPEDFQRLAGETVQIVCARGVTIRLATSSAVNLVIAPEYGGRILLHADRAGLPSRLHLALGFDDGRALSIRLTGMGFLCCAGDDALNGVYVYRRDFSDAPDPLERALTAGAFTTLLAGRTQALKAVLVGKEAAVVGVANGGFQDVVYRAGLHPRRKASGLTPAEARRLHRALQGALRERLRLRGHIGFVDLYGRPGRYEPAMGPGRQGTACPVCGSLPEQTPLGGGRVYYCPGCQR